MEISEEQKRVINALKQIDNFDDLCETCYYIDTERKTKYGCCGCREEAKDIVLNLIEKLQKENEELKEYLITQNCEINRLNLAKIRLELSQIPDTTEQYKYLKNEYKMRLERTDFENYKSNYISIKKVKDKIEELNQKAINYGNFIDKDESFNIESKISILKELLGDK